MANKVLRVRSATPAVELGSALAHALYEGREPVMRCIGPSAVNQAVKAFAIAQDYASPRGLTLSMTARFADATVMEGKVSAIELVVSAIRSVVTA